MKIKKKIRLFYKLIVFVLFIFSYGLSSILILSIHLFSFESCRKLLIKNISYHSKIALWLFQIKLKVTGNENITEKNYLIVSNHLSYLDVLVISSVIPTCFVTSVEMKNTFFLGQLCSLGGCLFVERRSKKGISSEVENLTVNLKNELNVTIFPEATSGNGESILSFKRPLFQSSIDSNKNILPVCLNYKKISDQDINLKNRDIVFWYGSMTFLPHFINILQCSTIEISLEILKPINLNPEITKVDLASMAFEVINQNYQAIYNDKRHTIN